MKLLSADELEARLRDIGARRYHNLHPFHRMLHGGKCSKGQVQAWALNRYYYQAMIPLKDAGLIARCEDPAVRREWQLFSPAIIGERVEGMLEGYDFVTRETLAYFEKRPPQAERDSGFALAYVKANASTPDAQQAVLAALEFKCDVLWAMLDALDHAYVAPKHVPPGAFVPKE